MAEERVQIAPVLESVLRYCLKDARERMERGEEVVPFSALAVGDTLFMEEHSGANAQECYAGLKKTVSRATGASAYGFCYDGYVTVGDDYAQRDCLIAEGGCAGEPVGHAIGLTYELAQDGSVEIAEEPIYVGETDNYMADVAAPAEEEDAGEQPNAEIAADDGAVD